MTTSIDGTEQEDSLARKRQLEEEQLREKQEKLSVKEAADLLGVASSKLRYWEKEGLIPHNRDETNNYRTYDLHALIEAGDVLFYRDLGVPLSTLKDYRELSIDGLQKMLEQTQREIEERIKNFEEIRNRLAYQREVFETLQDLRDTDLIEGYPNFSSMNSIDYRSTEQWRYLARRPQEYGVVVSLKRPRAYQEVLIDYPDVGLSPLLWKADHEGDEHIYLECVVAIDNETQAFDLSYLFQEARKKGYRPIRLIGRFLATAKAGNRLDYYRAWIECSPR